MRPIVWVQDALPLFEINFERLLLLGNAYIFSVLMYTQMCSPDPKQRYRVPYVKQLERVWNLVSGVFSGVVFWGCMSTWGDLAHPTTESSTLAFWIFLYCFTKPLELVDTLLLMMQGKNIRILHWSHHIITLLFTWYATRDMHTSYVLFVVVNLFVHWVMYFYYFFSSFKSLPVHKIAFLITWLQIAQFVVCLASILYHSPTLPAHHSMIAGVMYFYYLALFTHMYFDKYFKTQ